MLRKSAAYPPPISPKNPPSNTADTRRCSPTIGHLEIPVIRHSRESGNPDKSRRWIPAYAGMTGFSSFPIVPPHVCSANGRISFLSALSNAATEFQKGVSRDIRAQHHPSSIIRNIYSNPRKEPNQPTSRRANNKYPHAYIPPREIGIQMHVSH